MTTAAEIQHLQQHGLYSSGNEHDACGLGFVAHIKGVKRHDIVTQALKILENIDHHLLVQYLQYIHFQLQYL